VEDSDPAVGQRVKGAKVAVSPAAVGEVVGVSPERMLERAERPLEAGIGGPLVASGPGSDHSALPEALVMGEVPAAFLRAFALS
jgi:hypothetical protein